MWVLGIAGGSGSGKTTLAKAFHDRLGNEHCVILGQDRYYFDQSEDFDRDGGQINFDHPDAIDFTLMAQNIKELKAGRNIEVPQYDFSTHRRAQNGETLPPCEVLLVDGILILSQPVVRDLLDVCFFVDVDENIRFERRLKRDTLERGRTPEGVRDQFYNHVKPMHDQFVEPSRENAHLVLDGTATIDKSVDNMINYLRGRDESFAKDFRVE